MVSPRKRPPPAVFVASLVLLWAGIPMMFAATVDLVRNGLANGAVVVGLLVVGVAVIVAALLMYAGKRTWWLASFALLPLTGAARFYDAHRFGDGGIPVLWGIVIPLVGVGCLLLPAVREFFARPAAS